MRMFKRLALGVVLMLSVVMSSSVVALADDIDAGGTGQGDITGTNVYTFSYNYCETHDAIELTVNTKSPIVSFGNTTSHTYHSSSDNIVLHTSYPICGRSLDSAISDMINKGGYNFTVAFVKEKLGALGFYDKGNGVWKMDGGYLTFISGTKIRPQKHTVHYDANGGSGAPSDQTKTGGAALTLSSKKPTRTGYSFKNWTASIGGTYNPGDSYTHDQDGGTVTMKANWTPWKHTIHYDANGGSGAPSNQTKTYGSALTLSSTKPTKAGYTFKGWTASIGGTYQPGGSYTHDQNGGTVTMKAKWADETKPGVSSFTAVPNYWSAGNGTITLSVQDKGSGIASIVVERYSNVTKTWTTVKSWTYSGETSVISKSFSETQEGVYYYKLTVKDVAGNVSTSTTNWIYLDHSNPVITGLDSVPTDWVRVAPVISVSATDYLTGTSYQGSGPASVKIQDDAGKVVASGVKSANYTLATKYEGIHTWTITAKDAVGHTVTKTVTTKYDCTPPGIDGTEVTYVKPDGTTVSGYCQDNMINQHIDDETSRSVNTPNASSGLKSVILYRVKGTNREVIYSDRTKMNWTVSDTHSSFDVYYEVTADEKMVSYYELIVTDFAGNRTTKILTSQYSLLSWFHTSIDRSSYR